MKGVRLGEVKATERAVVIVASGSSLAGFDLSGLAGLAVIAVNAAVLHCPAKYWITVDPCRANYELMANPKPGVRYFAAVPPRYGRDEARVHPEHRVRPLEHVTYLRRVVNRSKLEAPLKMQHGLAKHPGEIHTGNSAYGALGLAYHMRPKRVALLGVDARGDYFYGGGGPRGSLSHLPALFRSALFDLGARRIDVVNGSPDSLVTCFPRMDPGQAVEWVSAA